MSIFIPAVPVDIAVICVSLMNMQNWHHKIRPEKLLKKKVFWIPEDSHNIGSSELFLISLC